MTKWSQELFNMGIALVQAQAAFDRVDMGLPPTDQHYPCKGCGMWTLGHGDFPYHSFECKQQDEQRRLLEAAVVTGPVQ